MMRFLFALLLIIAPLRLFGAVGDVVGLEFETNGWVYKIRFDGMTNQGSFDARLDEHRNPTASTSISIVVADPGYDTTATAVTNARIIYVTRQLRSPYPNTSSNEFIMAGDLASVSARLSASDWIYSQTSIRSVTIRDGTYTANGISNLALTGAAWTTNNSTNLYSKPVANWAGYDGLPWLRGTTAPFSIVAFDHHSNHGQPVAAVKFWATDGSGNNTATTVVSRATKYITQNGLYLPLFATSIDVSGLDAGTVWRHFEVLPTVGTNTLNTAAGEFTFPSYQATSIPFLHTNLSAYGQTRVWVDPVNGSDTTGVATTNELISLTNTFKTVQAAKAAIIRTNWAYRSRADEGGGVIYLTNGTYNSSGTEVKSNTASSYCLVTTMPGVDRSSVNVTNAALSIGGCIMISNVTFNSIQASATLANNCAYLSAVRCHFQTNTGTTFFGSVTNIYIVDSVINQINAGLQASGSINANFRMLFGNDFSGFVGSVHHGTFVGNYRSGGTNGALLFPWTDSANHEPPSYPIVACSAIYGENNATAHLMHLTQPSSNMRLTNGFAIVGNIFEVVGDTAGDNNNGRLISISVSTSSGDSNAVERGIIACNTLVGARGPHGFDNSSSAAGFGSAARQLNVVFNNSADQINVKTDKDSTANGAHLGSLPADHGVGWIGNTDLDPIWMDPGWGGEFRGIGSVARTNWSGRGLTADWAVFAKYINRQTASGLTNIVDGGGNYRLHSSSPLFQLSTRWYLPWDLEGVPTSRIDPPGAFVSGNPKKGAFF